jgi:exopolysaccharide biosynthesis polyprenyl glycosylphosphotransferase
MITEKEAFLRQLAKVIDTLCVSSAFVLSYFLTIFVRTSFGLKEMAFATSPDWSGFLFFAEQNIILIVAGIPAWIIFLASLGAYNDIRTKPFYQYVLIILPTGLLATLAIGSLIFAFKLILTSRLFIFINVTVSCLLLIIAKLIQGRLFDFIHRRGYDQVNLLIVGTGKRAQEFIRVVKEHSNWGLNVVGLIDDEHGLFGKEVEGYRVLGRLQDIPFILHRIVVDRVIFVVPRLWLNKIDDAIKACEREGISTAISVDLYNLNIAKVRQTDFSGFPLLEFETFSAKQWQLFVKRTLDIALSVIMIILFSPILLATTIAIRMDSKGPILFRQTRSGLNGRKFTLYKFRTMIVGAEFKKRELEKMNEMDGPVFKMKKDPRITRIGRFLRKFSIDELPQLINVLKGNMSVVGPRPPLPVEVELYQEWQRRRLSLKPGLTCIWQVSGRNNIQFEKWMEMDLEYIDDWSLWLDFKILFKTVFVVMFGYGAS